MKMVKPFKEPESKLLGHFLACLCRLLLNGLLGLQCYGFSVQVCPKRHKLSRVVNLRSSQQINSPACISNLCNKQEYIRNGALCFYLPRNLEVITPSVTEMYIVSSGLTQLGRWQLSTGVTILGCGMCSCFPPMLHASSVARYVSFCFQAFSGKATTLACWLCLPQNVLQEQHACVRALQPVPF